ncbi:MAG: Cupin 2 domain-containing protein [Candidatus Peregrinibacteria bacterium GW2011_GWA2_44_7]|nr:MAG: Cupin 2 domain-containing protein [Candidatus Peregrinibacteria bacterium GW2011_GWA2_44_7]
MQHNPFAMPIEIKIKPWGREIWFAHTEKYAGKILEVKKGHRLSLQYHEQKRETQYVYSGKVKFIYGPDEAHLEEKILNPGEVADVPVGMLHRVEALEDSQIFEVSTPELTDVVKLADDYGRFGKGNDESKDQELARKQNPSL